MKIADALLVQKDISEEVARLRAMGKQEGYEYRTTDPNAKWVPTFDLEANHQRVLQLQKLQRKLSRAISVANNTVDLLGIADEDYKDFI